MIKMQSETNKSDYFDSLPMILLEFFFKFRFGRKKKEITMKLIHSLNRPLSKKTRNFPLCRIQDIGKICPLTTIIYSLKKNPFFILILLPLIYLPISSSSCSIFCLVSYEGKKEAASMKEISQHFQPLATCLQLSWPFSI